MSDPKEPKDLGVKVATRPEKLWMKVRDEAKSLIQQSRDNLTIQQAILSMAKEKIANEKK